MRCISGLLWAKRTEDPWGKQRLKGAKAAGKRYEKLLAKSLPAAEHNPWFEFCDSNGVGKCSPDLLWVADGRALVVECKLRNWREAWEQLENLYLPVVKKALGVAPVPVVVVRYASPGVRVETTLRDAILNVRDRPVLHWIGSVKLPLI